MLLWIHPVVQALTGLLALYVLRLGLSRFAARHLGKTTAFQWDRHVLLGRIVVLVWAAGALGGLAVTYVVYGKIFPESLHFRVGLLVLPVLLVTWLSGTWLNRHRNQSRILPVVHMANNVLLLVLFGMQAVTGLGIVQSALLK
jgi:hypothetical protein